MSILLVFLMYQRHIHTDLVLIFMSDQNGINKNNEMIKFKIYNLNQGNLIQDIHKIRLFGKYCLILVQTV